MSAFYFNDFLAKNGLPLADVRLLRHQEWHETGQTPYSLWVESPKKLNLYQEIQRSDRRNRFAAPFWASFVVTPDAKTLFVGVFSVQFVRANGSDYLHPFDNQPLLPEVVDQVDRYRCELLPDLSKLAGRMVIDWGPSPRAWVQRADSAAGDAKEILEIRERFVEPTFPGFQDFVTTLGSINSLPNSWRAALSAVGGIYLLTCPKTKEQYVGQAFGGSGFLGRWLQYAASGHGGNIALKSRDPSDYQICVLETCGSQATQADIDARERLWKQKLQSREMGLNRN